MIRIDNIASITEAEENSLTWLKRDTENFYNVLKTTKSKVIITHLEFENKLGEFINNKVFILVEDPKLAFINIANKLFTISRKQGIHHTATVESEAKIGKKSLYWTILLYWQSSYWR